MTDYTYSEMTAENIYNAKQQYKRQRNNEDCQKAFETIKRETSIALTNIEDVIASVEEFRKIIINLRQGKISFVSELLGLVPKGNNGSYYRAFLAMNEQDILEVRFSNHYETKKAALEKSNNRTQYLYQVVLKTPSTKMEKDSISNTTSIANLKILTNGVINRNTSEDEIKVMLMNIHDFLISPSKSFEDTTITNESKTHRYMKNRINLNERTLKSIIAESVKRIMLETAETPYGKVASGDWKPTFDDTTTQERFKVDTIAMLSRLPDERFVNFYWNRRFSFTDADTVDAIYKEAIKRGIL